MSQTSPDYLTPFLNLLSVIVAAAALLFAVHSERRAREQFEESISAQERIAAANIKPLLSIDQELTEYTKQVVSLQNHGIGTAVMTNIIFTKQGRTAKSLPTVFNMIRGFRWDAYEDFRVLPSYLRAGDRMTLLELSSNGLHSQGLDAWTQRIFDSLNSEMRGTEVSIELEDVLGNKLPTYQTVLP